MDVEREIRWCTTHGQRASMLGLDCQWSQLAALGAASVGVWPQRSCEVVDARLTLVEPAREDR